jgi:heat-inducible transcriptional repressor
MSTGIAQPEDKLTARQRDILRTLVQEYISYAAPLGSTTLQHAGRLTVSSATIRNELVILETLGYVVQPHTSAGRMPTVRGYRYFVEQLMEQVDLPVPEQRMIRHQFHQVRLDLDQWMRLAAAVLAHKSQAVSLVTPPHAVHSRFKHLELISIRDTLCLMILVLQDGSIHQEMLELSELVEQATLSQTSNKLNAWLGTHTVPEIEELQSPELTQLRPWEAQVWQHILSSMKQADRRSISEVYKDGLINVLRQPEFVEADKRYQVLEILEEPSMLEAILTRILNATGIQILIGGEGISDQVEDVSMVLSPYGIKGSAGGVLGVVGPMRMSYDRAISVVRYVANLLDSLITDMYAD